MLLGYLQASFFMQLDTPRKPELIIRESQPVELPPDVVRSSDKNDLGLSELQQLNVKERYNIFEHAKKDETRQMLEREERVLKRGSTVLSKMAKYVSFQTDVFSLICLHTSRRKHIVMLAHKL